MNRLWYFHLFWICSFIKTATGIYARRPIRAGEKLYCRVADRLFGGTRLDRYFDRRQKEYEWRMEKIRELKAEQQIRDERRFDDRLLEERYNNPHFVISNRLHQDR